MNTLEIKTQFDIDKILSELEKLPEYKGQIMLQSPLGISDPFLGIGRTTEFNYKEIDFLSFIFDMPYTNSIIEKLGMFRTRVMRMSRKTCYTYHQDKTPRIHIPLITHENCFFVYEDRIIRCPANGNSYYIDTRKRHTFVNSWINDRIHIVGCVKDCNNLNEFMLSEIKN